MGLSTLWFLLTLNLPSLLEFGERRGGRAVDPLGKPYKVINSLSALLFRLNKDYKKISVRILGAFKMSVSHAGQGLQRFSKLYLASVECRAQCQSNAVLGVGPMPWGVSQMPLPRRPNAVPLSVECRVGVGRMPYPAVID
jgi:hypothetical protein